VGRTKEELVARLCLKAAAGANCPDHVVEKPHNSVLNITATPYRGDGVKSESSS
jgi:hypothetical protein